MTDQNSTGGISLIAYGAARESAAWFDRSDEGRLWMAGADLSGWLQGLLTNDISGRRAGDGFYAAYLTPQGRMVSDLRVLVFERGVLADVPAAARLSLLARLEMFIITEDVEVRDISAGTGRLEVVGPSAAEVVERLIAAAGASATEPLRDRLVSMEEDSHITVGGETPPAEGALQDGTCIVAAAHDAGKPGFDVYSNRATHDRLLEAVRAAGVPALDAATWDVLRVEAGRPRFGHDLGEETLPPEAGIDHRAVSYTKGCFVGQEILVRMRDIGHGRVARRLVELRAAEPPGGLDSARLIPRGAVLEAGGRRVGHVTSSVWSPREAGPLAFGFVHRDSLSPGTRLDATDAERRVAVLVGKPVGHDPDGTAGAPGGDSAGEAPR